MRKRGQGSNCFDNDLLVRYYDEYQKCFICYRVNATDFHHNIPRANKYTSSIFNAIPLCRKCHNKDADFNTKERQISLFVENYKWLQERDYKFLPEDLKYIEEYKHIHTVFWQLLNNTYAN